MQGVEAGARSLPRIRRVEVLEVVVVVVVAAIVRGAAVLSQDFPVHDGGLFAQMIAAVKQVGTLPTTVSYGGLDVPFAYPPLAFLIAGALPIDPIESLRFLPLVASVLTVPVVYLIATELLPTRTHALVAALVFALVPRGWEHIVAGGGLTRAPGLLFALLAAWQILRLLHTGGRWNALAGGVFAGLAALSHPEAAVFVAMSLVLIVLLKARDRRAWAAAALAAAIAVAVVVPWLVWIVGTGSSSALLGAGSSGLGIWGTIRTVLYFQITDEPLVPFVLMLGILGIVLLARRRSFLIPLWLLVTAVLASREGPTYASVPLSLAAAVGLLDGLGSLLGAPAIEHAGPGRLPRGALLASLVVVVAWESMGAMLIVGTQLSPVDRLADTSRATMAWVRQAVPADARFAVVSGAPWWNDLAGEWFQTLAERPSVATAQGSEWRGGAEWQARLTDHDSLQDCAAADSDCLVAWLAAHGSGARFVYLVAHEAVPAQSSGGASALIESVRHDPRFVVLRDTEDGLVARIAQVAALP